MARSKLKAKQMSKRLWGEFTSFVVYIINRCPTKKLNKKIHHKVWLGLKPSVSHLKIFGSICFIYVPELLRSKLDGRSQVMVMVGYYSKGAYKLFSPIEVMW